MVTFIWEDSDGEQYQLFDFSFNLLLINSKLSEQKLFVH
jgi:hypothetical protein